MSKELENKVKTGCFSDCEKDDRTFQESEIKSE